MDEFARGVGHNGGERCIQFANGHKMVTPIEVGLARSGVGKDVGVDALTAIGRSGTFGNKGVPQVGEGSRGRVGHSHTNLGLGGEVEIVTELSVGQTALLDARSPSALVGPGDIALQVEDYALIVPRDHVLAGEATEGIATPTVVAVRCWVDVELMGVLGIENLGVGKESRHNRVVGERCQEGVDR